MYLSKIEKQYVKDVIALTLKFTFISFVSIFLPILFVKYKKRKYRQIFGENGLDLRKTVSFTFSYLLYYFCDFFLLGGVDKIHRKYLFIKDDYEHYLTEKNYDYPEYSLDLDFSSIDFIELPYFSEPLVSIIIPCHDNYRLTMNCIRSIQKYTCGIAYEVIVADDNSDDETKNISSHVKNVVHVLNTKEKGFSFNCNSGANAAKGLYLLFLNNDTQVQPDYLLYLLGTLKNNSDIGIVGSMLLNRDNTIQEAGASIFRSGYGYLHGFNETIINKAEYNYVRDTDYVSGAALFIRKDLFNDLDGFDEIYGLGYYEDVDLCLKTWSQAKKRVVFQPLSRIVHFGHLSFDSSLKETLMNKNKEIFFKKNSAYLAKYHIPGKKELYLGKDHSVCKKQMLVFDDQVLTPSFDTGSRVTLSYMQFFKKNGFNVKFFCPLVDYSKFDSITNMQQEGFEIITSPISLWLKKYGQYLDCVFLTRPNLGKRYISMLRTYTNAFIIFYGHDLYFLRQYRLNVNQNEENADKIMQEQKKDEIDVYRKMDLSVFASKYEEDLVRKELPFNYLSTIPIFLFDPQKMDLFSYDSSLRQDLLFVGGFRHTPNIEGVIWFVNKVFPSIKKQISNLKFYIVGSFPPAEVMKLSEVKDVIVTGFVSDEELSGFYSQAKLVVAPLLSGAGLKGKIIEALYNKVPVVTTSVGAEGIDNSLNVISIADSPEDFSNQVVNLYFDDNELNKMSNNSKKFIENNFTENVTKRIFSKYIDI